MRKFTIGMLITSCLFLAVPIITGCSMKVFVNSNITQDEKYNLGVDNFLPITKR